jgi:hypothetical protein
MVSRAHAFRSRLLEQRPQRRGRGYGDGSLARWRSWPDGAAEVKEIYMAMGDATPTGGYAVSLKIAADSAGGAN